MAKSRNRGNGEGTIYKRQDGGPFYVSWYDAVGKRKSKNTKTTDRAAAQRILAKILAEVALRRDGVIDARQEALAAEAGRSVESHLTDFEAMMNARARSEGHVKRTLVLIREVCTVARFESVQDISADGMNRVMTAMKAAKKGPARFRDASSP